jgi:hypothetical protein
MHRVSLRTPYIAQPRKCWVCVSACGFCSREKKKGGPFRMSPWTLLPRIQSSSYCCVCFDTTAYQHHGVSLKEGTPSIRKLGTLSIGTNRAGYPLKLWWGRDVLIGACSTGTCRNPTSRPFCNGEIHLQQMDFGFSRFQLCHA